jgi:hypothetical protein
LAVPNGEFVYSFNTIHSKWTRKNPLKKYLIWIQNNVSQIIAINILKVHKIKNKKSNANGNTSKMKQISNENAGVVIEI